MQSALLDVIIVVTVAPRSPPSPIPGIRPMRTPDTPVNVLVVATVVDVALSLLCPLPVAAGGMQPLRQLARRRRLRGGGMRSALLDVIVVVAITLQSLPSPIPGIRQTRNSDTPVNVLIVVAVVDVALSLLCLPPVAASGMQPLCQLARRCHLQAGGMQSALLDIIVVVAVMPQSPP